MQKSGGKELVERAVIAVVVVTVCLPTVAQDLPRVVPWVAGAAVVFVVVRLVFFHTRRW